MKSRLISLLVLCLPAIHTHGEEKIWQHFIPDHFVTQYAGSIGIMNFGIGWDYYRNHWETEAMGGWVPKYSSQETKPTLTLKQRYIPWRLHAYKQWDIEPLTTGMFLNTIFGDNFWHNEPDRYGGSYYGFSPKVRVHAFIGQRLRYNMPMCYNSIVKSISAYYELSTCDLYIVSAFVNNNIRLSDILSLAFGIRLEIL